MRWTVLSASVCICLAGAPALAGVSTVLTDADATVWATVYQSSAKDTNYGSQQDLKLGWNTSNNNMHAYMHFDLSGLDAGAAVTEARLQVAWASTPYDPGWTLIYAIMDEAKDWDLTTLPETGSGSITWDTAPQTVPWPVVYPFLEEGAAVDSVTRELGQNDTPTNTPAPIDLDVTALVQWMLGQNAGYSTFADTDGLLTICMREGHTWSFVDYYSKEYTPEDASDAPRLVITQEGGAARVPGDVHDEGDPGYGCVDGADYTIWADNYNTTGNPPYSQGGWSVGNFTEDDTVDGADYTIWADHYLEGCGGAPVPEPGILALLVLGAAGTYRRRK